MDNSGLCQKGWEAKKQVPDIRGGGSILPYTAQSLDLVSKFGGHVGPWFGNTGDTQWGGAILVGAVGLIHLQRSRAVRPLRKRSDPATCTTNCTLRVGIL